MRYIEALCMNRLAYRPGEKIGISADDVVPLARELKDAYGFHAAGVSLVEFKRQIANGEAHFFGHNLEIVA